MDKKTRRQINTLLNKYRDLCACACGHESEWKKAEEVRVRLISLISKKIASGGKL
jgi:hypothetical protein